MKKKFILLIAVLILIIPSVSCKKDPSKKYSTYEKKEKAPENLRNIYGGVNSALDNLEKIKTTIKEPEEKLDDNGSEKAGNSKQKKEEETKEEKLNKLWMEMNKSVKEIHGQWNNYEIEATKKVGSSDGAERLEESLNNITLAIENKDVYSIINNGSQMFLYLAPFFDLYKDEIKGDLCKIKYYVYQSYLIGESGELDRAKEVLYECEPHLTSLRHKLGKDENKMKAFEKLSFSIRDLEGVLKENNSNLLTIKRDIILDNIKQLEK